MPQSSPKGSNSGDSVSSERSKTGIGSFGLFRRHKQTTDKSLSALEPTSRTLQQTTSSSLPLDKALTVQTDRLETHVIVSDSPLLSTAASIESMKPKQGRPSKSRSVSSSGLSGKPSWLCQTKFFKDACRSAFETVDVDGSGTVDGKELYCGLLLLHLKLGTYAGPAACRPLSRERCDDFFKNYDINGDETLDQDEFSNVMALIFGNVMLRVITQWSMTLLIVPFAAHLILDTIQSVFSLIADFVANLDGYRALSHGIESSWESSWSYLSLASQTRLTAIVDPLREMLSFVPDAVWASIPLTFLSTLLGTLLVPRLLLRIDTYFQDVADRDR